jgi:hypothetical protein
MPLNTVLPLDHLGEALAPNRVDPLQEIARRAFLSLHDYLRRNEYKGWEFDDLLGSPLVHFLTSDRLLLQRAAVQVGKHCPVNIRPLLRVRKLESAKARGFVARAYLTYYLYTNTANWLAAAEDALAWLLCNCVSNFPGISWGNEFDFASRGGFFRKGLPTVVWTSHIADSFDLAYAITGKRIYLDAVLKSGEFVANALERHYDEHGLCFAYAPGRLNLVYNSNLLGAATLLRCWNHTGNREYFVLANAAYKWTTAHMNVDDSWHYGVGDCYHWIDNFHTAYNLECLELGHRVAGQGTVPFTIVADTYKFWIRNFFLVDGTPRYYHNRTYPLDVQCAAQAIETLSKIGKYFPDALETADRVVIWTLNHLQKRNGAFRFQTTRLWRNNLESIHWGQATMLSALSTYLYARATALAGSGQEAPAAADRE